VQQYIRLNSSKNSTQRQSWWMANFVLRNTPACHCIAASGVADDIVLLLLLVEQFTGLVPIVEPEVLIDGTHSAAEFGQACERVIGATAAQLWRQGVQLEGCLLKPQMIIKVRRDPPHPPACGFAGPCG
jgi:fructose-bisphosphate aldolase class I